MSRKYTPEQLAAEIARPKSKGGRPRKYETEEERKLANAEAQRRRYWRQKNDALFIADDSVALQKQFHGTEEERRIAKAQAVARHYEAHREEVNFRKMASYVRCKT